MPQIGGTVVTGVSKIQRMPEWLKIGLTWGEDYRRILDEVKLGYIRFGRYGARCILCDQRFVSDPTSLLRHVKSKKHSHKLKQEKESTFR